MESSPPEMPTTALSAWVWASRFFNPIAWIVRISSQRWERSLSWDGTKGRESKNLVSFVSSCPATNGILGSVYPFAFWKVVFFLRSLSSLWMSISV